MLQHYCLLIMYIYICLFLYSIYHANINPVCCFLLTSILSIVAGESYSLLSSFSEMFSSPPPSSPSAVVIDTASCPCSMTSLPVVTMVQTVTNCLSIQTEASYSPVVTTSSIASSSMATDLVTIMPTSTTKAPEYSCPKVDPPSNVTLTEQEASVLAREIAVNLTIDARKTSSYVRRLSSADDTRNSSRVMGWVGIFCVCLPLFVIFLSDLKLIMAHLRIRFQGADIASQTLPLGVSRIHHVSISRRFEQ